MHQNNPKGSRSFPRLSILWLASWHAPQLLSRVVVYPLEITLPCLEMNVPLSARICTCAFPFLPCICISPTIHGTCVCVCCVSHCRRAYPQTHCCAWCISDHTNKTPRHFKIDPVRVPWENRLLNHALPRIGLGKLSPLIGVSTSIRPKFSGASGAQRMRHHHLHTVNVLTT